MRKLRIGVTDYGEDDGLYSLWARSIHENIDPDTKPLNENERQIFKNHKEQSYLKDLKNAVENYYKVNYDEFNNAFNGAFKDKHFFKAKKGVETRDKRGGFIYNASDDVKFLLALKPYFESGLYKILDENDLKRIEENIIRILKEEHLKYRNKPLNEWLTKEWVEKDVANLLEAKASPFTQKQELENKEANVHTLREQTKELLSALVGKNIANQNDGRIASISRKNIMKMTSDKAIQKSVNNGFTPQEHFKAVQDIESLYQAAVLKETHADRKSNNPNVFIHRYTADFNGNNALITIKESLDNNSKGNKIYTLELEALELKPSAPEPQGSVTMSKNTGYAEPVTPNETHKSIITQKNENIPHSNPHLGAGLVGGTLNGLETDEDGNITGFDPAKFAMGFLGGAVGSKAVRVGFKHLEKNPALKEKIITELADTLAQGFDKARAKYPLLSLLEPRYIVQNERGRKIQAKVMLKELEKEQKGLYNVAYNGKNASLIKQDLASVENAIALMQGTRYKGAKHERIKHLTDPSKEGYVTDLEFVNLGKSIREFLKHYEPFIDTNGARLYEWEKEGVRFRVVVNDIADMDSNPTTATEEIITFYSDRNLKEAMNFKNPVLKVQEKFKFNPQKAKDLLEWHKNSHALTKDENNLPKVFYHGTGQKEFDILQNKDVNFEVFKATLSNQDDDFLKGHYFSSNIKIAKTYTYNNNIYKVFLNAKNPLVIDFKGHTFNDYIDEAIDNIPKSVQENIRDFYDSIIFKNIIDDSTQNGKKHPVADTIMVFNSNQIKHINNKGSYTDTKGNITKNKPKDSEAEHKYFNEKSENIYYSNPHLGAGLVGGVL
ncbi:hypothetical protein CUPS4256_09015, partial [Campylobacter upsaliensis]|uniref:ADP-ribosyltransferase-containing protein n=1 Tax=Campylobacter upsaliensis TaxID=28080 RepID=UPI00214A1603